MYVLVPSTANTCVLLSNGYQSATIICICYSTFKITQLDKEWFFKSQWWNINEETVVDSLFTDQYTITQSLTIMDLLYLSVYDNNANYIDFLCVW